MQTRTHNHRSAGTIIVATFILAAHVPATDAADRTTGPIRAGAHAIDITPSDFPVIVNGSFRERTTDKVVDPLHARCLVLDDGTTRLAIAVVDSCIVPRDLLDEAKQLAHEKTGIPTDRMLISSTHTHSAPSVIGALGSRPDPDYPKLLTVRIAEGIDRANRNLQPARIGWTAVDDPAHTNCRRWILRPDKIRPDPFGGKTVRAYMHPGYQNPDFIGPAGPVDTGLSLLSIQTADGKPLALLANYSMHYFGAPALSADYYGRFANRIGELIGADDAFVGIMSQGTSGDLHWMDYSQPKKNITLDAYADGVAQVAHKAYKTITYRDRISLAMTEAKLELRRRAPDEERLAWAKETVAKIGDRLPKTHPEIYAHEALFLHEQPVRELKLQAVRIGDLGITAIPNEVYGITGLKIKTQSPLATTFNIELANGGEGYIPPPEQHKLGGYTTWPARSAALEVQAEPRIVETLLTLLEQVSDKPRRNLTDQGGRYAKALVDARPVAYWRFSEFTGPTARDVSGRNTLGQYEDGVAFYLEGPDAAGFSANGTNRAAHFAGGRMKADIEDLGNTYTAELWFWNGLPSGLRPVTGYFFSRGPDGDSSAPGDHLGIGGTHSAQGRLFFFNGNQRKQSLAGRTEIKLRTWNHVALVREGKRVRVYLNGNKTPEIDGEVDITYPADTGQIFIGGRNDNFANFEGKIDEVAIHNRPLAPSDIARRSVKTSKESG